MLILIVCKAISSLELSRISKRWSFKVSNIRPHIAYAPSENPFLYLHSKSSSVINCGETSMLMPPFKKYVAYARTNVTGTFFPR